MINNKKAKNFLNKSLVSVLSASLFLNSAISKENEYVNNKVNEKLNKIKCKYYDHTEIGSIPGLKGKTFSEEVVFKDPNKRKYLRIETGVVVYRSEKAKGDEYLNITAIDGNKCIVAKFKKAIDSNEIYNLKNEAIELRNKKSKSNLEYRICKEYDNYLKKYFAAKKDFKKMSEEIQPLIKYFIKDMKVWKTENGSEEIIWRINDISESYGHALLPYEISGRKKEDIEYTIYDAFNKIGNYGVYTYRFLTFDSDFFYKLKLMDNKYCEKIAENLIKNLGKDLKKNK